MIFNDLFKDLYFKTIGVILAVAIGFNTCTTDNGNLIKSEDIINQINKGKNVLLKNKTITGNLDFTKVENYSTDSQGRIIVYITSSITFVNCSFSGKIIANQKVRQNNFDNILNCTFQKNITFLNCVLNDTINFNEAEIFGLVNFCKSTFYKPFFFEGVQLNYKYTYFTETLFKDKSLFYRSLFNGTANFINAKFENIVGFQKAIFRGECLFNQVKCENIADFSLLKCYDSFICNNSEFQKELNFSYSTFFGRFELKDCKLNGNNDFKNSLFYGICRFTKTSSKEDLSLENSLFLLKKPEL